MILVLCLAIVAVVVFHLSAMAACARLLGVGVNRIVLGMGRPLLRLGLVHIAPIPLGGHVQLARADDGPKPPPAERVFDRQPRWKRFLLPLTGPAALLALGCLTLGAAAGPAFAEAFGQIVGGALHPFGAAQAQLAAARAWLDGQAPAAVVGTVACKVAAYNLLPFLGSNGVQAVYGLLPASAAESPMSRRLAPVLLVPALVLAGGWLLGLLVAALG